MDLDAESRKCLIDIGRVLTMEARVEPKFPILVPGIDLRQIPVLVVATLHGQGASPGRTIEPERRDNTITAQQGMSS